MIKTKPIIEEINIAHSAERVFEAFCDEKNSIFLDSGMDYRKLGRFSIIVADPFLVFKSKGKRVEVLRDGNVEVLNGNPLNVLKKFFYKYQVEPTPELPTLTAGAVGYFGYDLGWQLEKLPSVAVDDLGLDDIYLGFYDWALIFDNLKKKNYICSTGLPEENSRTRRLLAKERIKAVKSRLSQIKDRNPGFPPAASNDSLLFSNFKKTSYLYAVEKVKEYIASGDIYQANLSQRFTTEIKSRPYELYKRLRLLNPAPFASFHNLEDLAIVSSSPERFLRISGRDVSTRPIKGTRPRGKTISEDKKLKNELLLSKKDRAELIMIVDLERNDLGRVCDYGSVRVDELIALEKYSTVFHLVSTVAGRLHKNKDHIDCIKACFPGGSITGAPKIRAMEILEELEPTKRGLYTGSIGYLGFNRETDLNIVIRTIIAKGDKIHFQVGGGIVADSMPENEYQETLDKAKALIDALYFQNSRKRKILNHKLQIAR